VLDERAGAGFAKGGCEVGNGDLLAVAQAEGGGGEMLRVEERHRGQASAE
jgi:hypothetical protein